MLAKTLSKTAEPYSASDAQSLLRYDSISIEEGQRPVGFRFFPHIINIRAQLGKRRLIFTGEADSLDLAHAKARAELIERSVLLSSPECGQAKTSNGWAAHPDQAQARLNAVLELVERDAVLAQWYSAEPLLAISKTEIPPRIQAWVNEELSRSEFPELVILLSTKGLGPSVSCILKNGQNFGVTGHATRATLADSIESALAEACRAAHASLRHEYWADSLKLKRKVYGIVDPGAHSVYYAYHEPLPTWIFGEELTWAEASAHWIGRITALTPHMDDFSFCTVQTSPLFVGFAQHPLAFELRWGTTSKHEVMQSAGAKRLGLETINIETHFVS